MQGAGQETADSDTSIQLERHQVPQVGTRVEYVLGGHVFDLEAC